MENFKSWITWEEGPCCPTRQQLEQEIRSRIAKWEADSDKDSAVHLGGLFQFGHCDKPPNVQLENAQRFWLHYVADCCRCGSYVYGDPDNPPIPPPCGHLYCSLHEGRGHECTATYCEEADC